MYGPLLDRFGRKKPLYAGLVVYLLATLGCAVAWSANALIAMRFIQALGGCVGMVASRAMVRDIFPVEENAKVFSMLMLVIGVSPIIAPTLGGYLTAHVGWRYVFGVLILMDLFILSMVYFTLPESRPGNPAFSLRPNQIFKQFAAVFINPQFYTYSFTGAVSAAGLYAYIAGSPYVFMQLFKATEQEYGWIFAFNAAGLIVATQINTRLLKKFRSQKIIFWALLCQGIAGVSLFVGSLYGWLDLYGTIGIIAIFLCAQGFTFPNSSALSMAPFSHNAGSASALMGGIQMSVGATASAIVNAVGNHGALPMTGVMACCAVLSFIILNLGHRAIRYKARKADVEAQNAEMISTT